MRTPQYLREIFSLRHSWIFFRVLKIIQFWYSVEWNHPKFDHIFIKNINIYHIKYTLCSNCMSFCRFRYINFVTREWVLYIFYWIYILIIYLFGVMNVIRLCISLIKLKIVWLRTNLELYLFHGGSIVIFRISM